MPLKKTLFWFHLITGVSLGLVILSMCISGACLAFEPQLTQRSEHALQTIPLPASPTPRLKIEALLAAATAAHPDGSPSYISIKSDPSATILVGFGKADVLYVDPYTARIIGPGSNVRATLHEVEEWHRWLANKTVGKKITGAAAVAFFLLAISGIYLWLPRRVLSFKGQGHGRDWNWHNTFGLLSSPIVLMITTTGIIMSYGLLKGPSKPKEAAPTKVQTADFETLFNEAAAKSPEWTSILLRIPQRPGQTPAAFTQPPPAKRPLRALITPLHTGRFWGVTGQTATLLAALAGIIQIWTGLALAIRRFLKKA